MTSTTTRSVRPPTAPTCVPVTGARGAVVLVVHPSGSPASVSCEERGLSVTLDPTARREAARHLLDAAELLENGRGASRALQPVGTVVGTLPDGAQHLFEIEVVQAPGTDVVLLTCEALGVDGVLAASAARHLGQLLLHT